VSARVALLFPGLGAYCAGMLRAAAAEHPQVAATLEEIDEVAGRLGIPSVGRVVLHGDPVPLGEVLKLRTEVAQLAIFGASVTVHRILAANGVRPYVLVGHSFGEIAALVSAGAFTVADGVRLVCARAEALTEWEGKGAMAAVGANTTVARHLIGALDEPALVVACMNAPQQTVLSGPLAAIGRAERVAAALDLFFARLHLPYASHHPAARRAAALFLDLISDVKQETLVAAVYSPVHGRRYTDADDIKRSIADCMVRPVDFVSAIRELHAEGVGQYIECGALNALTRCTELTVPDVRTMAPLLDPADEIAGLRRACGDRPEPVVPAARKPVDQPDRSSVLARLRALYAEALEYPEHVLTEDALLEAELGVDSLKQTALLAKVATEFGLGTTAVQVWDLPSLGAVADHVLRAPAGALQ
jgi:acyl transferase domain-containing protein